MVFKVEVSNFVCTLLLLEQIPSLQSAIPCGGETTVRIPAVLIAQEEARKTAVTQRMAHA